LASILLATACAAPDQGSDRFVTTDSTGIRIAHSEAPRLPIPIVIDSVPKILVAADFGAPDYVLFDVGAGVFLQAGGFVVANEGTSQLFRFTDEGTFVGAFGRSGSGPGEFERLFDLNRCGDDQLIVEELSRLTVLDGRAMEFDHSVRVVGHLTATRSNVAGIRSDCSAALLEDRRPPIVTGPDVFAPPVALYWADLVTGEKDSIGTFGGGELMPWEVGGRPVPIRAPFGHNAVWAVHPEGVAFGSTRNTSFRIIGAGGRVLRVIRWDAPEEPVTDEDWSYLDRSRIAFLDEYPEEGALIPPLGSLPRPDAKPAFAGIMVDPLGRVWLQAYGRYGVTGPEPSSRWQVFLATGEWLAEVHMPRGLRVLAISDSSVLGVTRRELDLEQLQVHSLPMELSGF
jgi:hypothetical protein